jgi:hypothetical protein
MKIRADPPPFVQNIFKNLSPAKPDRLLVSAWTLARQVYFE